MNKILFWFRRDLRVSDNRGLFKALSNGVVIPCFILDSLILDQLPQDDTRFDFICQSLLELKAVFSQYGSDLVVYSGDPVKLIPKVASEFGVSAVYINEDYEPYAVSRDNKVRDALQQQGVEFCVFQDHLIFAKEQILNKSSKPYTVYTPYKNAWLYTLEVSGGKLDSFASHSRLANLVKLPPLPLSHNYTFNGKSRLAGGESMAKKRLLDFIDYIDDYDKFRDVPAIEKTSYLGVDLRFGTVSVRYLVQSALAQSTAGRRTWLNELIWREFFSQILYNFPHVVNQPFQAKYDKLIYPNNMQWYEAWCQGNTGYPIVDAGMRQLNQTGFMHNRVRMITASFLCKDLLIDWRLGEHYFALKLLDYELASNNGNWQWCASTGCDAQPYFRVFNPILQAKKFDMDAVYIKRYIPELKEVPAKIIHDMDKLQIILGERNIKYPQPIINHSVQSKMAVNMFKVLS